MSESPGPSWPKSSTQRRGSTVVSIGREPGRLSMPTTGSRLPLRPGDELLDRLVVAYVLVAVGHHRAAPVPPAPPDDVHLGGEEGVGVADHRADVEVVLPVLDRHVEVVPAPVQVGDHCLPPPVAVPVDHVAPVALGQQLRVVAGVRRRVARPRADTHLELVIRHVLQSVRPAPAATGRAPVSRRDRHPRPEGSRRNRYPQSPRAAPSRARNRRSDGAGSPPTGAACRQADPGGHRLDPLPVRRRVGRIGPRPQHPTARAALGEHARRAVSRSPVASPRPRRA